MTEGITNAKDFLDKLEKCFEKSDKAKTSTLLHHLISIKYNGKKIREYIMEMSHIVSKLKGLKLELSKDLLVHSLPVQYSQFKVSYNFQKEKNELLMSLFLTL